jgi:hypothetical protein
VFHAADEHGGPDVAIKVLRPQLASDPVLRRQFMRGADLARTLDHACLVKVLACGEHDGAPYLAMELVAAETLRTRLDRERQLAPAAARGICVGLAQALDHAHAHGVIHGDVKPENTFVSGYLVKLGDFGNTRVMTLASATGHSLTWGTPEYVAPEQFHRARPDPRSDLFALGVVYYEMLTGRLPWSRNELLRRLAMSAHQPPRLAPTGAGPAVDRLIADLLASDPRARPASGAEVVTRVHATDESPASAPRTRCTACGALRPDDLPRCLSCGEHALRVQHTPDGIWRVVLNSLPDDATATGHLLEILDPLIVPPDEPVRFHLGAPEIEGKEGVLLPAVLLAGLDEASARAIADRCRAAELDVAALPGTLRFGANARGGLGLALRHSWRQRLIGSLVVGWLSGAGLSQIMAGPRLLAASLLVTASYWGLGELWSRYRRRASLLETGGLYDLRPQLATVPAVDPLLAEAAAAVARLRAPEVRAMAADVAMEMYRLARRDAEALSRQASAPNAGAELAHLAAEASAAFERVGQLASRLDSLDDALAAATTGELMQRRDRLARAAAAPNADRAGLAAALSDVERTIDRRSAAESDRARLAARLCRLLGELRALCRTARTASEARDAEAARQLAAATAELDAFLSTVPPAR